MNSLNNSWHSLEIEKVFELLKSEKSGLSVDEARERLIKYGLNEIEEDKKKSNIRLFIEQLKNPIVLILFGAALISLIADKIVSTYVILIVIVFNSMVGFLQEFKAEKSLEALRSMSAPEAEVLRNCSDLGGCVEQRIKARDLVPGDILVLDSGDIIPADARLFEAINLEIDEALLTGESLPVLKNTNIYKEDVIVAERKNMAFSGTIVTKGRGKGIIVSTGINTELGKVAQLLKDTEEGKTPLQEKTSRFGILLSVFAFLVSIIVFFFGILRGYDFYEMFLFALSTMVSAIPEGLPAAISIALAIGVNKMAGRNAIVKKMQAIDTIGAVTTICTDKTGTLTTNQMTAKEIHISGSSYTITGVGFSPEGEFKSDEKKISVKEHMNLNLFLEIITLCNDSRLRQHQIEDRSEWEIYGDPTEGSLIVASHKAGIHKDPLDQIYPRIDEIPFTSELKFMATFHQTLADKIRVCVKGAPERVLSRCRDLVKQQSTEELGPSKREELLDISNSLAKRGLRVLAIAYKEVESSSLTITKEHIIKNEKELIFLGFVGLIDPPRQEVKKAIQKCKNAGIRVKMITGDHKLTAQAIGSEIGLLTDVGNALSGSELEQFEGDDFDEKVGKTEIFARVSPTHKYHIVQSLMKRGEIIAMTGDGVNDAPALKEANVGVAMGITGTDVTKNAADIVLTDDNFSSIVNAIEEGRVVRENIQKITKFLLSTNLSEIVIILISLVVLVDHPLIFTSILILWINLVTDGSLTITLAQEPKEGDVMNQPPKKVDEKLVDIKVLLTMIYSAVVMAVGTIGLFLYGYIEQNLSRAQTMAFLTLALFQVFNAFNNRSKEKSIFKLKFLENKSIIYGAIISGILLYLATILPFFQEFLGTVALSFIDWILAIIISSSIILAEELRKFIALKRKS